MAGSEIFRELARLADSKLTPNQILERAYSARREALEQSQATTGNASERQGGAK